MKTLVIVSHPYPNQSKIIKALQQAAENTADVTVRNLETLYGNNVTGFDVAAEQRAHEGMDRIVYLFPLHWFNLSPMLKAYLNEVWSYGWAYGSGNALKGKEMLVVTSAGAVEDVYSPNGHIGMTMDTILSPMKACATYVGMNYLPPQVFYNVMVAGVQELASFQTRLVERLTR